MAGYVKVARRGEIAPGRVKSVRVRGREIAVCNVDGEYYAVDDVCTHDGGSLGQGELTGCQIECPRHGARFDVRTGQVVVLPAMAPLRTYPVEVAGDDVRVAVE